MELVDFPNVIDDEAHYYGGSQEWYAQKWHSDAGCAATAASNLAAFYHLGIQPLADTKQANTYSKADFRKLMDLMFGYMTPHFLGFPNYRKFARRFVRFAKHQNCEVVAHLLGKWKSSAEAITFINDGLNSGNPVALLVLTHQDKQFDENTWHWMTITGMEDDKVILSNYGHRESYSADNLFQSSRKNRVRLIWFELRKD